MTESWKSPRELARERKEERRAYRRMLLRMAPLHSNPKTRRGRKRRRARYFRDSCRMGSWRGKMGMAR